MESAVDKERALVAVNALAYLEDRVSAALSNKPVRDLDEAFEGMRAATQKLINAMAEADKWKQTVRDIFDVCVAPMKDVYPSDITAIIMDRHRDYFGYPNKKEAS